MADKIKEKIQKNKSNIRDYKSHKVLQASPLARTTSTYVISTNKTSKNVPNTPHKIIYATKVNPEKANCKICQRTRMKSNLSHHTKTAHGTSNNYKCQNCEKIFTTKYSWQRHAQIHKNCIAFKLYLPAKLGTKLYKLDPSIRMNYIYEQSLMTGQKLYEWALYKINLPIPELSLPRTRPHVKVNNNDVRAIPLENIPHTKAILEDARIFYDTDSLPSSPTSSEIDELDQLLQKELFNNGILCKTPATPPCDIVADAAKEAGITSPVTDTEWRVLDEIGWIDELC